MKPKAFAAVFGMLAIAGASFLIPAAIAAPGWPPSSSTPAKSISIFGRISDASGKPLTGARILLQSGLPYNRPQQPVASGADGMYQFGPIDVPAAMAMIRVYAAGEGHVSGKQEVPLPSDSKEPIRVDFVLQEGHWIAGRVVDARKTPQAGVSVSIDRSAFDAETTNRSPPFLGSGLATLGGLDVDYPLSGPVDVFTKADGKFRFEGLPNQPIEVRLSFAGGGPILSMARNLEVDREGEIVVPDPGLLRGRVIDAETKKPIVKFSVALKGEQISRGDPAAGTPFNDPDGRFAIRDADPTQPLRLSVRSDGYAEAVREHLQAEDGKSTATARESEIALWPENPLKISLVDQATGAPIAGAALTVGVPGVYSRGMSMDMLTQPGVETLTDVQKLTTDASGSATAQEGSEPATILIRAAGYPGRPVLPDERANYALGDHELKIPLSHGETISGTVDFDGHRAAGEQIVLIAAPPPGTKPGQRIHVNRSAVIDASGHYRFDGVPAGAFSINVNKLFGNYGVPVTIKRGQIADGQDLIFNIGDDAGSAGLFGTIVQNGKPAAAARVWLQPLFDGAYRAFGTTANADGEYRILGLPPGAYAASISGSFDDLHNGASPGGLGRAEATIEALPGAMPTRRDFELLPPNKVAVHLTFPPDFPAELRAAIAGGTLAPLAKAPENPLNPYGDPAADAERRTIRSEWLEGDRLVFAGRFQGAYRLALMARIPDGMRAKASLQGKTMLPPILVAPTLNIDASQGDVDLGEIAVPLPPAIP